MIRWPWNRPAPEPSTVPVDPAAIVRRARRLRFRVRPTAAAELAGAYLSARPGTGLTFAELKPYEPGDDVRHIDWNVTARQGRPFVRRFIEERALELWIVLDISASLRFGLEGRSKADRAAQAAALIAAAAIQNGDHAGLTLVSDRIEADLPPGGGPRHLARLLRMLVASPASSRMTNLSAAFRRPRRSARRGLLIAISDFLTPEPVGPWRRASSRGEVVAVRVVDPREEELPPVGPASVQDAETGRHALVDTSNSKVQATYRASAEARRREYRFWCSGAGVTPLELSTDEDPIAPLLRHFRGRADRGRARP